MLREYYDVVKMGIKLVWQNIFFNGKVVEIKEEVEIPNEITEELFITKEQAKEYKDKLTNSLKETNNFINFIGTKNKNGQFELNGIDGLLRPYYTTDLQNKYEEQDEYRDTFLHLKNGETVEITIKRKEENCEDKEENDDENIK